MSRAFLLFSLTHSHSSVDLASDINATIGLGAGLGLHSSEVSIDELQFVTKVGITMIDIMRFIGLLMALCCFWPINSHGG